MSEESIDALRAFYDALNRRDIDQALQEVHPKVEVRTALDQIEAVGGSRGPIRGHEGVREWFDNTVQVFEKVTIEFKEIVEGKDGQIVAVENWRVRGGQGIEFDTVVTDVYGFRDGLIVRCDGFRDKAEALEAAGLSE